MRRIVLDGSALRRVSSKALTCLPETEFVISPNTIEEVYTHADKGTSYSREHASRKAYVSLSKICSISSVLMFDDPVLFEVEMGLPGAVAPIHRVALPAIVPILPVSDLGAMRERESGLASLWGFPHHPQGEAGFRRLRAYQSDQDLWPRISDLLQAPDGERRIREFAIEQAYEQAPTRKWKVSADFNPSRNWITYGFAMAYWAYRFWKLARYGDEEPKNPANVSYDLSYIAEMAICDGVFSCDKTLLHCAWACWPEKREHVLTCNCEGMTIETFRPRWLA